MGKRRLEVFCEDEDEIQQDILQIPSRVLNTNSFRVSIDAPVNRTHSTVDSTPLPQELPPFFTGELNGEPAYDPENEIDLATTIPMEHGKKVSFLHRALKVFSLLGHSTGSMVQSVQG